MMQTGACLLLVVSMSAPAAPAQAPTPEAREAETFSWSVDGRGIRVLPHGSSPTWQWSLELVGYGRDEEVEPVVGARVTVGADRIDYARGEITEWFVDRSDGVKHGFTLASPPPGSAGSLVLELTVAGGLVAHVRPDGLSVDFADPSSGLAVLGYTGLVVHDATGRELLARMEAESYEGESRLRLVISDRDAVYPVTVDPLVTSPSWTRDGFPNANEDLGWSVASAGDVNGDGFDDIIYSDAFYLQMAGQQPGVVLLHYGSANGPADDPDWVLSATHPWNTLGLAVSSAGDVDGDGFDDIVIASGSGSFDRTVYVFHGSQDGLTSQVADWSTSYGAIEVFMDADMAGDVNGDGFDDIIVGDPEGSFNPGTAYVYHGSATGLSAVPDWTATGDLPNGNFGRSVSSAGDVNGDGFDDVIVGATSSQVPDSLYVYHGSPTGPSATEDWTVLLETSSYLGHFATSAGDVDADGYDDLIATSYTQTSKRVVLLHGSASGLSTEPDWVLDGTDESFGWSADAAGDVNGDGYDDVIVGGWSLSAEVYLGSAAGLSSEPVWVLGSSGESARTVVAGAGDVNADSLDDVIVGGPALGEAFEGKVMLYLAAPSVVAGPAGAIPATAGAGGAPLRLRVSASRLTLSWGESCHGSDADYEVYHGVLGDFTSHAPLLCSTAGATSTIFDVEPGDEYYLVVPRSANHEGSYGRTGAGEERAAATEACMDQQVATCGD